MINDKGIFIKNIFYMLSYAFQDLRKNNYEDIDKEDFENVQDLLAEILFKGVSAQLKQGLFREYIEHNDSISTLKGRINIMRTIKHRINKEPLLACEFDELTEDNIYNQIIKSTILLLVASQAVKKERRNELRSILPFFDEVSTIQPKSIRWSTLSFQRNNKSYRMLINICYFVIDGMLLTTENGSYRLSKFSDNHMARLYEKFVLEYYKRHHPELNAESCYLDWELDKEKTINDSFLPQMHSDITLTNGEKKIIIDTKYYQSMTLEHYGQSQVRSSHLYQIHTYVTSAAIGYTGSVLGMLLYAKVDGEIEPNLDITQKNGVRIMARTLDLSKEFKDLKLQLERIIQILN